MADILEKIKHRFGTPFDRLSPAQRMTMLMVFVLTIIGTAAVLRWATQPEYATLVADLEPAGAQAVIEELKNDNIPYKIVQDGRSILVPRKNVYEYRMKLASKNLTLNTGLGYEIFDQKDIGISEFVQQVNYRRALEGELVRTIQSMPEVHKARVHIVFPKQRLFKEDQKEPTASIFLSLKSGIKLSEQQISGMTLLVAGSVEGLTEDNVTIVDNHGKILSLQKRSDTMAGLNNGQLELQMRVESYLQDKAQSMLDQVLGPGHSIVRLSAALDFRQIEKTSEMYDQDLAAVLSEEEESQTFQDSTGGGENTSEHRITNYQLPKSIERVVNDIGSIERLSVSVLVNGKYEERENESGETVEEFIPRSDEELARFSSMVRNAVGINTKRNDQIDIQCVPFENPWAAYDFTDVKPTMWEKNAPLIQKILLVLLLIGGFFVVRSKLKKAKQSLLNMSTQLNGDSQKYISGAYKKDVIESNIPSVSLAEAAENESGKTDPVSEEVKDFVQTNPLSAAQLIKSWMLED